MVGLLKRRDGLIDAEKVWSAYYKQCDRVSRIRDYYSIVTGVLVVAFVCKTQFVVVFPPFFFGSFLILRCITVGSKMHLYLFGFAMSVVISIHIIRTLGSEDFVDLNLSNAVMLSTARITSLGFDRADGERVLAYARIRTRGMSLPLDFPYAIVPF